MASTLTLSAAGDLVWQRSHHETCDTGAESHEDVEVVTRWGMRDDGSIWVSYPVIDVGAPSVDGHLEADGSLRIEFGAPASPGASWRFAPR